MIFASIEADFANLWQFEFQDALTMQSTRLFADSSPAPNDPRRFNFGTIVAGRPFVADEQEPSIYGWMSAERRRRCRWALFIAGALPVVWR